MCLPQDPLLRHVPAQPIPPQRHVPPENRLVRHVTRRPIPPRRHVPPAEPATATCTRPTDPAPATCASRRTRYRDMYPTSRPGSSDMCLPEDPLLRHVPGQPGPLQRHVLPGGSATATCAPGRTRYCDMCPASRLRSSDMFFPEDPLLRHVRPGRPATATCDRPTDPAPATCACQETPTLARLGDIHSYAPCLLERGVDLGRRGAKRRDARDVSSATRAATSGVSGRPVSMT